MTMAMSSMTSMPMRVQKATADPACLVRSLRGRGPSLAVYLSLLRLLVVATAVGHAHAKHKCAAHEVNERIDHTPYDANPCCTPGGERCNWQGSIPDCERKNIVSILKWFKDVVGNTGQGV